MLHLASSLAFPKTYTYAGYLSIRTQQNTNWRRKYFVLHNNFLLCGNDPYVDRLAACIPLEGSHIRERVESSHITFELTTTSKLKDSNRRARKKYYFRADSHNTCSKWTEYIEKASTLTIKSMYRLRYRMDSDSSDRQVTRARVIAAKHRVTNEEFAIKIIDKRKCDQQRLQMAVQPLKRMSNPHIVEADLFENRKYLYLIMEMCHGHTLLDQIAALDDDDYTVAHCIHIIHQIAEGIKYIHSMGVVVKDLQLKNILCKSDSIENVKIYNYGLNWALSDNTKQICIKHTFERIVFGFVRNCQELLSYKNDTFHVIPSDIMSMCFQYLDPFITVDVDIASYPAPELLMYKIYDKRVDYWSIGIILYILICGYPPFKGNKDYEIAESILIDDVTFDDDDWKHISNETKELIKGLLAKDPSQRKTPDDVLMLETLSKFRCLPLQAAPKLAKIKNWMNQRSQTE